MESTKQEREDAQSVIFHLHRKTELYLRAGDTDEVNSIRCTVAHLSKIFGVHYGVKKETE